MVAVTKAESREAVDRLREWLSPGDTVYTILRHVSRSGMQRSIDCIGLDPTEKDPSGSPRVWAYGWNVAKALGEPFDRDRDGVKVRGAGMDMGFHLVYSLSRTLFPDGFGCVGEGCPSNDHSNGDRDYTPAQRSERCDCLDRPGFDGLGRVHARCNGTGYVETGDPAHVHADGGYALRQRWL